MMFPQMMTEEDLKKLQAGVAPGGAGGIVPAETPAPAAAASKYLGVAPTQMPSASPQHFGMPMADVQAGKGGYGTTPSGHTYGYAHGESMEKARMNALGKGGVGDQAEALKLFRQSQGGPNYSPFADPNAARAAFNNDTMQSYLGLSKQAVDAGRAGVEEYLGVGRLGNDRIGHDIQRDQLGISSRGQDLLERKAEYEMSKDVQKAKMYDGLILSGKTTEEAKAIMRNRDKVMGPNGTMPTGMATGAVPGLAGGPPPFDPDNPNMQHEQAFGTPLFNDLEKMTGANTHTATILSTLRNRLGDQGMLEKLPAIKAYVTQRYGTNAMKDALNPGHLRTWLRAAGGGLAGGSKSPEGGTVAALRAYLGMDGNGYATPARALGTMFGFDLPGERRGPMAEQMLKPEDLQALMAGLK